MKSPNYAHFVEKFKHKKTTDDCYTPPAIYDAVVSYVKERHQVGEIVRPFFPGGDYESFNYPDSCTVIDNPPFSMITKIVRFYCEKGIKFFLFAPHLTIFQIAKEIEINYLLTNYAVTYENGAKVPTSFVSNLFGDSKIICDPDLYTCLSEASKKEISKKKPTFVYPDHVITAARLGHLAKSGKELILKKTDVKWVRVLDSQRQAKKNIFGSGFFISDEAVKAIKVADKKAAELAICLVWTLSDREKDIIKSLNQD
jgi:hypothetical protein